MAGLCVVISQDECVENRFGAARFRCFRGPVRPIRIIGSYLVAQRDPPDHVIEHNVLLTGECAASPSGPRKLERERA